MRADIGLLRELEFDTVILDEAQAIKNAGSESAKAARLLRGQHRLALSGTPIENHIGELWSLFEFLNPGMLGAARAFEGVTRRGRPSPETTEVLSRALRPFILRRTKEVVAPELPPKHEETILCELERPQRRLYDELRDHYRAGLLGKLDAEGDGALGKSKILVLEALLRLRQASCHPGLIDKKRAGEASAKLDVLLPRLEEVRAEGHKALVFSQFTSFLAILRSRLDEREVPYQYLDGDVQDRQARVARFQEDPTQSLFLISLKAGGVGLNLTAADYVFILDPWWNPAVEAQAVDRAHRIGQDKHVFVYRLLCRDTVEEKVAALQESKRGLAESIIGGSQSLVRDLDRQTLELLLS
jgi:SNF2 family DNA or RNA helicase